MYSIVSEEAGLLPRERLLQKGAEVLSYFERDDEFGGFVSFVFE